MFKTPCTAINWPVWSNLFASIRFGSVRMPRSLVTECRFWSLHLEPVWSASRCHRMSVIGFAVTDRSPVPIRIPRSPDASNHVCRHQLVPGYRFRRHLAGSVQNQWTWLHALVKSFNSTFLCSTHKHKNSFCSTLYMVRPLFFLSMWDISHSYFSLFLIQTSYPHNLTFSCPFFT